MLEGIDGVAIEAYEFSGVVLNNNGFTGANGVGGVEVDGESVSVGIDGVDGSGGRSKPLTESCSAELLG